MSSHQRSPGIFINLATWKVSSLDNYIDGKVNYFNTLSTTISSKCLFLITGLKISSLPIFALKSNNIFMLYAGNRLNTSSSSSYKLSLHHHLYPKSWHAHSERLTHRQCLNIIDSKSYY